MVKAGALGSAHVKSWDRTWSNSDSQKAHRGGLVLKLRPVVTMADIDHILGSRMAEWLRLRALEENGLNIRRICRVRIPLPKKSIDWAVGDKKHVPSLLWLAST